MWFVLAIAAAAFIISFALLPKPKVENARAATLDQFQLPRSNEGDPVPLVKGTVKLLSPNTIGSFGFRAEPMTQKVSTGLFSSKNQITGYKYHLGLNLALCLGPMVRLKRIWFGEKVVWSYDGSDGYSPFKIEIYKDANYGSKVLTFTDDVPNLNDIGLNDGTSSFKAFGTWDLFVDADYSGASIRVTGDNPNLAGTAFQDKISSMRRVLTLPGTPPPADAAAGILTGPLVIDKPNFFGGKEGNGGVSGKCYFYEGSMNQAQNPYLQANLGEGVPAYHGISHFVMEDFYVGNSPNLEAISFELQCFSNSLGLTNGHNVMQNGLDENPVETLFDLYTTFWGRLGVDPAYLDVVNFRQAAEVVWAENNGMSLTISSPNTGGDLTKEIIRQINAILYQDIETGKIRIKLIRQDYVVADLPVLRPSNILEITNYSKTLWDETYNQVRIKHKNRANNYQEAAALWQDFANINMQQRVRSTDISMPGVYDPVLANILAAREGSELNVPLLQCEFDANRTIADRRPGDCFVLNWPEYKIYGAIMRIRKFDTSELANGKIVVVCVQDEFSSKQVVFEVPETSGWEAPDTEPDPIIDFALLASPYFFRSQTPDSTGEYEALWALARKPDPGSLSYDLLTSLDTFGTSAVSSEGTLYTGAARLAANYPPANGTITGFDSTTSGMVVGNFDGDFLPTTVADVDIAAEGMNVLYTNGEFIGYRTVTDLGDGTYRLTNLRRALFDTTFLTHVANQNVYFVTSVDGVGDTRFEAAASVVAKLLDKAPGGRYREEDATILGPVAMDSRSLRPAPPTYLTYEGVRGGIVDTSATATISWRERNRSNTAVRFFDDPTDTPEVGQDNRLRWRYDSGAWTTVNVTGNTVDIDTSAAATGAVLSLEVYSRRNSLLSRVPALSTIYLNGVAGSIGTVTTAAPTGAATAVIIASGAIGTLTTTPPTGVVSREAVATGGIGTVAMGGVTGSAAAEVVAPPASAFASPIWAGNSRITPTMVLATPSATRYFSPAGQHLPYADFAYTFYATEGTWRKPIGANGTLDKFGINIAANDRTTATTLALVVNGVDTTQTISVAAGTTGWVNTSGALVNVVKGDLLSVKIVTGSGSQNLSIAATRVAFTASAGTVMHHQMQGDLAINMPVSTTVRGGPIHGAVEGNSFAERWDTAPTATNGYDAHIQTAGKASYLSVFVRDNTHTTNLELTLFLNGVATALKVTVPAGTTGQFTNAINEIDLVAGDRVSYRSKNVAAGSGSMRIGWAQMIITRTASIYDVYSAQTASDTLQGYNVADNYFGVSVVFPDIVDDALSSFTKLALPVGGVVSKFWTRYSHSAGGSAYNYTLRKNGVNTALVLAAPTTSGMGNIIDNLNTVSFADGDRPSVAFRTSVSSQTPTAWGFTVGGPPAVATTPMMLGYTGSVEEYTIPAGVTSVTAKLWGGAGGTGFYTANQGDSGGCGFTTVTFPVTAGDVIKIQVGQGGEGANRYIDIPGGGRGGYPDGGFGTYGDVYCGGGGGASRIYKNNVLVAVAGAGGGGSGYLGVAGAGGGTNGVNGYGGSGGSQTTGGFKISESADPIYKGGFLRGGNGGLNRTTHTTADGGGGGGGYFGGGGGGADGFTGGGGSGWFDPIYTGSTTAGAGRTPALTGDADYVADVGVGRVGAGTGSGFTGALPRGGNGRVVVRLT